MPAPKPPALDADRIRNTLLIVTIGLYVVALLELRTMNKVSDLEYKVARLERDRDVNQGIEMREAQRAWLERAKRGDGE